MNETVTVVPRPTNTAEAVKFVTSELGDAPLVVGEVFEGRVFLGGIREYFEFSHGFFVATFESQRGVSRELWWVCDGTGKSVFISTGPRKEGRFVHFEGCVIKWVCSSRATKVRNKRSLTYNAQSLLDTIIDRLLRTYAQNEGVRVLSRILISYGSGELETNGGESSPPEALGRRGQ